MGGAAAAAEADDEARRPFTALSQVYADLVLACVPRRVPGKLARSCVPGGSRFRP
uniref:Uncharacterized protein n=1 Tax=Aegilops tauschii TaxID=37682 RepID=M8BWX2_AEGTA